MASHRRRSPVGRWLAPLALVLGGCAYPDTFVVMENDYPAGTGAPLVVYQGFWQAVAFQSPIPPGTSSPAQSTVSASPNTAYAVLAPGWNPQSSTPPASFVVLESKSGFAVDLHDTLRIPVDDTTFAGNCAAGSTLTQSDADFITQRVFRELFTGLAYDAATCTTSPVSDAGGP